MNIARYVLVDRDDHEQDHEYESYDEAQQDAHDQDCAVICRSYVYDDSELVWTPDGSSSWPPENGAGASRWSK